MTIALIAGVKIEIMADGTTLVAGYPLSSGYPASRGNVNDPVVKFGRAGTQAPVAATVNVWVDLPHRMELLDAYRFMCDHPKFKLYRELMLANPPGRSAKTLKEQLAAAL